MFRTLFVLPACLLAAYVVIIAPSAHHSARVVEQTPANAGTVANSWQEQAAIRARLVHRQITHRQQRPMQHVVRRKPRHHVAAASPVAPHSSLLERATAWANSAKGRSVRRCEADFDYTLVDVNSGTAYYGAWQANSDFWSTYSEKLGHPEWASYLGGSKFHAPRWMQDLVAYKGYLDRGWQPWACA